MPTEKDWLKLGLLLFCELNNICEIIKVNVSVQKIADNSDICLLIVSHAVQAYLYSCSSMHRTTENVRSVDIGQSNPPKSLIHV